MIEDILNDAHRRLCSQTVPRNTLRWFAWPQRVQWGDTASFTQIQVYVVECFGTWAVYRENQFQYLLHRPSTKFHCDLHDHNLQLGQPKGEYTR